MLSRRRFLGLLASARLAHPSSPAVKLESSQVRPAPVADHPILSGLQPVIGNARHVRLHPEKIKEVAGWMAYEELAWPDFRSPLIPQGRDPDTMDFIFLTSTINFAFTDFTSHTVFKVEYAGAERSDSEAMEACLKRAYDGGLPILEGSYLAAVTRKDLEGIFTGTIPIPMLDERVAIFREVGRNLSERYQGRFHRFVEAGPPRLYAGGTGLLERLLAEFPSFRDTSLYRGRRVAFQKRAQLLWWSLHARFRAGTFFAVEDPESLTVFADYILPVALRLMGITSYRPELEAAINQRKVIPADSEEEIEIRAFTLWAC
ncbi:MAG: queuosine salvage family protein, partial [Acidobacteriota bacterium]